MPLNRAFFTTRQFLCWSTINRRLQLQLATSASYQTFSFSICWKKALETWRCQNQLHHSDDPLSVEPCLFFNQSFCSACDDDIWYAFAKPADLSGDWDLRDDRRRMFTMQHDCVTAQISEDRKGLICQRCLLCINPTKSNNPSNTVSAMYCALYNVISMGAQSLPVSPWILHNQSRKFFIFRSVTLKNLIF